MKLRRMGAVAAVALLAGAMGTTGSASADTAEAYVGSAAGRALNLDLPGLPEPMTLGASTAKVTSALDAAAEGTGYLTPLGSNVASSSVKGGIEEAGPVGKTCSTPAVPGAAAELITLGVACAESSALVANGFPSAASAASVAELDLKANFLLSNPALADLKIGDKLDQVFAPLTGQVDELDPALTTVHELLNSILKTQTLAVELGSSTSKVVTDGSTVTSEATAAGGIIKILPTPTLGAAPELSNIPVATIEVSSSAARAVYDRASGTVAEPTFDAALVTIKLSPALGLPAELSTISVKPGQAPVTILAGTPLESTITVANGAVVTNADGTKGAVADGVKLELLKGVEGGILLELAHSEAGVAGKAATRVLDTPEIELPRGELPRTGGLPVMPFIGGLLAGAALIVRRAVASAR